MGYCQILGKGALLFLKRVIKKEVTPKRKKNYAKLFCQSVLGAVTLVLSTVILINREKVCVNLKQK